MGLSTNNIIFEDRSRNTHENIIFSRKIVNPKINEKWIIVTSAFHMNRSIFIGNLKNPYFPWIAVISDCAKAQYGPRPIFVKLEWLFVARRPGSVPGDRDRPRGQRSEHGQISALRPGI